MVIRKGPNDHKCMTAYSYIIQIYSCLYGEHLMKVEFAQMINKYVYKDIILYIVACVGQPSCRLC